ncbi:MAG: hypothetical protein GEU92_02770 [Alphaproteobacteria bacterium]|nr:hypothetical protein [Alphaproteobacteria bacterium]
MDSRNPETVVLHAGWRRDEATNAVAVPIYQTTSYQFDSTEHAANLFALKEFGNIYTRIMNSTSDVLERRVAALEGGAAALAVSSGQSSALIAVTNITGEEKRRADAYLSGGYGGLVGFEFEGGAEAGRRFIDALQMFYHVANIGDSRSLAIHPATTTHQQLSAEEQLATGVTEGYVRLSVGIEHIDDILADLECGMAAA